MNEGNSDGDGSGHDNTMPLFDLPADQHAPQYFWPGPLPGVHARATAATPAKKPIPEILRSHSCTRILRRVGSHSRHQKSPAGRFHGSGDG